MIVKIIIGIVITINVLMMLRLDIEMRKDQPTGLE